MVKGARTIGKKSSDLVETTKLKMEFQKGKRKWRITFPRWVTLVFMQYKGEEGLKTEVDRLLQSTRT